MHGGEQPGNSGFQPGFQPGIILGGGGVKRGKIFGQGIEMGVLPEHGGEQPGFDPGMIPEGGGNLGEFPEHGDWRVINGPINL